MNAPLYLEKNCLHRHPCTERWNKKEKRHKDASLVVLSVISVFSLVAFFKRKVPYSVVRQVLRLVKYRWRLYHKAEPTQASPAQPYPQWFISDLPTLSIFFIVPFSNLYPSWDPSISVGSAAVSGFRPFVRESVTSFLSRQVVHRFCTAPCWLSSLKAPEWTG